MIDTYKEEAAANIGEDNIKYVANGPDDIDPEEVEGPIAVLPMALANDIGDFLFDAAKRNSSDEQEIW